MSQRTTDTSAATLCAVLLACLLCCDLHEHSLVLEDVTLDLEVQLVVEVAIDLGRLAVLAEQTAQDAHAAHPDDLLGEASLAGSVALSGAGVAALGLRLVALVDARARVDRGGLADHVAISDQLAEVLAYKPGYKQTQAAAAGRQQRRREHTNTADAPSRVRRWRAAERELRVWSGSVVPPRPG